MKSFRGVLVLLGALPLLVAAGSYLVGEQIEVVALRTLDSQGHAHDTKLWIVDFQGRPWVRSARPTLSWVERIRANPHVELIRNGKTTPYTAAIVETADARRAIDEAIAAKYGRVDRWSGLLVRHDAIPIRLDPAGELPGR